MWKPFVIHKHEGHGPTHYDLMLSMGEALATWQLPDPPAALQPGRPMTVRRLSDHRRAYLTYEGPVSGGRGSVSIADKGRFRLLEQSPQRWQLLVEGIVTRGCFELLAGSEGGDQWTLRAMPPEPSPPRPMG